MAGEKYFHLYTKIYASKDNTYSNTALMIKDDIAEGSPRNFVGVGYPDGVIDPSTHSFEGPAISFASNQVVSTIADESENIESLISWPYFDFDYSERNTGILFTYKRNKPNEYFESHLWFVRYFHYNSNTNEGEFTFFDEEGHETGKIIFSTNSPSYSDYPELSPFTGRYDAGANVQFLCFNTGDNDYYPDIALSKKNGANWNCRLYIIDSGSTAFDRPPEEEPVNLELPSVYKPLYMRSLIRINNTKESNGYYNTRFTVNVYNGVGYYRRNQYNYRYYSLGNLTCNVGNGTYLIGLTADTPALTSGFSAHTISNGIISNAISSLEDINTVIRFKEDGPDEDKQMLFPRNQIEERKTVSFYSINYTTASTGDDVFEIIVNSQSFLGNSSSNVKYFAVTPQFYYNIVSGDCSYDQGYELNPQTISYSGYKFLSLYGVKVFLSYADYINTLYDQTEVISAVLLPDYIFNYTGSIDIHLFFKKRTEGDKKWHIIGITDPLIDLLVQDEELFEQEIDKTNGGCILAPHQNFVSIITYK